jgi:hypothetical protein
MQWLPAFVIDPERIARDAEGPAGNASARKGGSKVRRPCVVRRDESAAVAIQNAGGVAICYSSRVGLIPANVLADRPHG